MIARIVFVLFVLIHTSNLFAQSITIDRDSLLSVYLNKISETSIRENLSILASDSLQGRETGALGQKLAADYLSARLIDYGIKGAGDSLEFFQRFELYKPRYDKISLSLGDQRMDVWKDFYTFSTANDTNYIGEEIQFLGYGINTEKYSDYEEGIEYNGIGIALLGEPYNDGKFLISGSSEPSEWSENIQLKIDAAQLRGLSGMILINERFDELLPRVIYYQKNGRPGLNPIENTSFPVLVAGPETFNRFFPKMKLQTVRSKLNQQKKLKRTKRDVDWVLTYNTHSEKLYSENVLGMIKGKEFPNEYVFVTAHYDHLGKKGEDVYNGADDDGSGTSAVLEIARLFSEAKRNTDFPKRSIVFLWVSGEEKGLLGSEYYTEHPIYPLSETVVDLNIDMVGRRDTVHQNDTTKYIYLIGSDKLSSDLHTLSEQVNDLYSNYELDYTFNDDKHPSRLYYRSDHYNFAKNNIPVIFYFGGMHEDYHQPTDVIDKIDFSVLADVVELVMATAWNIADSEQRIEVDKPVKLVH